jgi:Uma2 family endonuclease
MVARVESTQVDLKDYKSLLGDVIAVNVSLEDYMENYAAESCEWVEGVVIQLSPSSIDHNLLFQHVFRLLDTYFAFRKLGQVYVHPFVMRLPAFPKRRREPDLLVVLNTNPYPVQKTFMDGPADICIEIISEESMERDIGTKFAEYQQGGVTEYWVFDPIHHIARFYRLNEEKRYVTILPDDEGNYTTPLLPGLRVHVPTLWQKELPNIIAIVEAVRAMLE